MFRDLDTYVEVTLNDTRVLQADNMFREWRVGVKPQLHIGDNRLCSHFRSSLTEVAGLPARYGFPLYATNNEQARAVVGSVEARR